MSDLQDKSENVVIVDEIFSQMRHVSSFEKRMARKKIQKIISGESSLYTQTIAREGIKVIPYLLIRRQARLLTETPALVVGVALLFLRGTAAAWPMFLVFLLLALITIAVTGIRTIQFVKYKRSLSSLKA